jgi:hypothetical protein
MAGFKRPLFWLVAIAAYWYCARWFLFHAFRIWVDGGGPGASFYWGHPLSPTLAEWDGNVRIQILLLYPYWIATSIITFLGCGLTTWLIRLWNPRHSRLFLASSATTLVSLLLVEAISDAGTALHVWHGPAMYVGTEMAWAFLQVMIPMSLLAGLLALARDGLNKWAPPSPPRSVNS